MKFRKTFAEHSYPVPIMTEFSSVRRTFFARPPNLLQHLRAPFWWVLVWGLLSFCVLRSLNLASILSANPSQKMTDNPSLSIPSSDMDISQINSYIVPNGSGKKPSQIPSIQALDSISPGSLRENRSDKKTKA